MQKTTQIVNNDNDDEKQSRNEKKTKQYVSAHTCHRIEFSFFSSSSFFNIKLQINANTN